MTMQMTFAMIKSHVLLSTQRHEILNTVLKLIIAEQLRIKGMYFEVLTADKIARLYQEHYDKAYYPDLCRSVSGSIVGMALAGDDAIARWRAILGATDPKKAAPHTLRALYGSRTHMADNVAHGSDTEQAARRELAIFFPDEIELWVHEGLLVRPVREDDPASAQGPGHVQ
jgi:nucleoside-diphosphate kinase